MNGTSGFREVRSSTSRLQSHRFLDEQRHLSGRGSGKFLRTHDLIARPTEISTKGEKIPGTIFIQILLMISVLLFLVPPIQLSHAVESCDTSQGFLEIPLKEQEESDWCWVASANVVTTRFGYQNSSGTPYLQCELYNLAGKTTDDCCKYPQHARPTNCLKAGMPDLDVWEKLNPIIYSQGNVAHMIWDGIEPNIKAQICPGGKPGQPFIFIYQMANGTILHTNVVKGFTEVNNLDVVRTLYVDTHYKLSAIEKDPKYLGVKHLEYDCGYVRPGACGKGYERYSDIYDIQQGATQQKIIDELPPLPPKSLTIQ